jgi:hypothetical protein
LAFKAQKITGLRDRVCRGMPRHVSLREHGPLPPTLSNSPFLCRSSTALRSPFLNSVGWKGILFNALPHPISPALLYNPVLSLHIIRGTEKMNCFHVTSQSNDCS